MLATVDSPAEVAIATRSAPILSLVELISTLKHEHRLPTPEEKEQMAQFMGWGPVAPALEEYPQGKWREIGAQLRLLLGPQGIKDAEAATPTSYFTDRYLVDALWAIASGLGFEGGRVLEPGCGSGSVLAAAPTFTQPLVMTGVERDPFSAQLAQFRVPEATIYVSPLESIALKKHSVDLGIGNVPFSEVKIADDEIKEDGKPFKFSIHNFFLHYVLKTMRPGSIAVLLTSRFTLDAMRDKQREILAREGILLGAIRLPSNAHKKAGTSVISDILILQKRLPTMAYTGEPWLESNHEVVPGIMINEYFAEHPEHIIGTPILDTNGRFHRNDLDIVAPPDLPSALAQVIETVIAEIKANGGGYQPPIDYSKISEELLVVRGDGHKEGAYFLDNDQKLYQAIDGGKKLVTRNVAELTALVRLKDAATSLLSAEQELDRPDDLIDPLRVHLNLFYDQYVNTYGYIHRAKVTIGEQDPETGEQKVTRRRPSAMYDFRKDPDYPIVLALEDYDDDTERGTKALIFHQRVNVRPTPRTSADSPDEALAICLDQYGRLDFQVIADLLGKPLAEIPTLLGDMVYQDPETMRWFTKNSYCSGNVRAKLRAARIAAEHQPDRFTRNVVALEQVVLEDLEPEQIKVTLGVPWVETTDIEQFCFDLFGRRPQVSYSSNMGWEVNIPPDMSINDPRVLSEWGTERADAFLLLEKGLNKRQPIVYDQHLDGSATKNVDETIAAQEKLSLLSLRFKDWVWEDIDRAKRLAATYNELFRSVIPEQFDGSHLSFPGMNPVWAKRMYPWQKDFVYRMTRCPGSLCAHPVGAGKTTIEIAGAMTLKRLGLISKAAIVVPGHLLEQITAEAQRLYPAARILMISNDDLSRDRRKLFAARVAMGNYDFVVMTHGGMHALAVHPDIEHDYIENRVNVYHQSLLDLENSGEAKKQRRTVKKLAKAIEAMRQKQRELLARKRDDGVTFEQLGVSYIIYDEAHYLKNLGLPTNIEGMKSTASQRATDMEMKLRWLEQQNEGRPFASFFTATPVSNSMAEAYVMAWYLDHHLLESMQMLSIDAFASTFVELERNVEVSPDGASFQMKERPSHFINMPELKSILLRFADIRDPSMLDAKRPTRKDCIESIKPSPEVQKFVNGLVDRAGKLRNGIHSTVGGKEDNMLLVTTHGRMAALDLSLLNIIAATSPKIEAVAHRVSTIYTRIQKDMADTFDGDYKGLQIVFCDLGTPNDKKGDQVYGKLKRMLVTSGIPASGIRFIHEAKKNDAAKALLFKQCRQGKVAVLIGSTNTMGTGTNIQSRVVAIHHMDAPWRPSDVEQRDGRGHRPGNQYPVVEIWRYVQERTFDAYTWQTLTTKAGWFEQIRRGGDLAREIEDVGDMTLDFGKVKAAATGDPLMLEHAGLEMTVARLQRLASLHQRGRKRDAQEMQRAQGWADTMQKKADDLRACIERVANTKQTGFATPDRRQIVDRKAIGTHMVEAISALLFRKGGRQWVGYWSGERITVEVILQQEGYWVRLIVGDNLKQINGSETWAGEKQRWRFAEALEQTFATLHEDVQRYEEDVTRYLASVEKYASLAEQPFPQKQELQERLLRKGALDAYIAKAAASKGDEASVAELAEMRAFLLEDAPDFSDLLPLPIAIVETQPEEAPAAPEVHTSTVIEELLATSDEEIMSTAPVVTTPGISWDDLRAIQMINKAKKKEKGGDKKKQNTIPTKKKEATPQTLSLWGDLF